MGDAKTVSDMKSVESTINTLFSIGEQNPTGTTFASKSPNSEKKEGQTSIRDDFKKFEGLPDEHPLKKKFDPKIVSKGYIYIEEQFSGEGNDISNYTGEALFPYLLGLHSF